MIQFSKDFSFDYVKTDFDPNNYNFRFGSDIKSSINILKLVTTFNPYLNPGGASGGTCTRDIMNIMHLVCKITKKKKEK